MHADKHESFLQIDIMNFDGDVPKIAGLQCLYNTSKKEVRDEVDFRMQINMKVSYRLISTFWASMFPTR